MDERTRDLQGIFRVIFHVRTVNDTTATATFIKNVARKYGISLEAIASPQEWHELEKGQRMVTQSVTAQAFEETPEWLISELPILEQGEQAQAAA